MLRNVCVALGNWASPETLSGLQLALNDCEALARGHAAWALGQVLRRHHSPQAAELLRAGQTSESDEWVRAEIAGALGAG